MKTALILIILLTCSVATMGNLHGILNFVRDAQLTLLKHSRSSNWGKPWIPD
jgi:hypothetical protein